MLDKEFLEFLEKHDSPELRQKVRNVVNETADIVKNIDQRKIGGDCAIFMYDKYNNFLFCFRQDKKGKIEIIENFIKFYKFVKDDKNRDFNIVEIFKQVNKLEFVGNVYDI